MNLGNDIFLYNSSFTNLKGEIHLIASKSISNRALLIQALSSNSFQLHNIGNSDDVRVMKKALSTSEGLIDLEMSGTALRFLSAGFCIIPGKRILDGHKRLKERPIEPLIQALQKLGGKITYLEKEGSIPVSIEGGSIDGDYVEMEQATSSQFISALMMIAPFLKNGLTIKRLGIKRSDSYIQLTKSVMEDLDLKVNIDGDLIQIARSKPKITSYLIESDWSSACYWMAFIVLMPNSRIVLNGLKKDSKQGDMKMLTILEQFNLGYKWEDDKLILFNNNEKNFPKSVTIDCGEIPDQAQTLVFLGALLGIEMKLTGLETLRYKETNRIEALNIELTKLGVSVKADSSSIFINGNITSEKAEVKTYNDHRMAMSASLLATRMDVLIEDSKVVNKSYPSFWNDLNLLTNASSTGK